MGLTGSDLDVVVCWDSVFAQSDSSEVVVSPSLSVGSSGSSLCSGTMSPIYCVQRLAAFLRKEHHWIRVTKVKLLFWLHLLPFQNRP
jgi:hypothetical protein